MIELLVLLFSEEERLNYTSVCLKVAEKQLYMYNKRFLFVRYLQKKKTLEALR